VDVLIGSERDYLRINAAEYLKVHFPDAGTEKTAQLIMDCPIREFDPESVLLKDLAIQDTVYLLLTGTVQHVDRKTGKRKTLKTGSLIGDPDALEGDDHSGVFLAQSYVNLLQLTPVLREAVLGKRT
jgi:hypothetical protein